MSSLDRLLTGSGGRRQRQIRRRFGRRGRAFDRRGRDVGAELELDGEHATAVAASTMSRSNASWVHLQGGVRHRSVTDRGSRAGVPAGSPRAYRPPGSSRLAGHAVRVAPGLQNPGSLRWPTQPRSPRCPMTEPSQTGTIVVSGTGRVAVDPDLAELRLGVAISRETVAEARSEAAATMAAVIAADPRSRCRRARHPDLDAVRAAALRLPRRQAAGARRIRPGQRRRGHGPRARLGRRRHRRLAPGRRHQPRRTRLPGRRTPADPRRPPGPRRSPTPGRRPMCSRQPPGSGSRASPTSSKAARRHPSRSPRPRGCRSPPTAARP